MRRFQLVRHHDATGISGVGTVAEGCQFSNGWIAMTWLTEVTSLVFYPDIENVRQIHGHGGSTVVEWLDTPPVRRATGQ